MSLGCQDHSPSEGWELMVSLLGCPSQSHGVMQQCLVHIFTLLVDHLRDGQCIGSSNQPCSAKGLNFVLPIKT